MNCPCCGGVSNYIGTLGLLAWFRCTACGGQFNVPAEDIE